MRFASLALSTLGLLSAAAATAAPTTLYDGGDTPTAQGWTRAPGASGTVTVGAGTTAFSTVNNPGGLTSQFDTYAYATGATDFIASITLQVNSSSHNPLDAGLTLSVFGWAGNFIQNDRYNNLVIDQGTVLWGDEAAAAAVANASGFHEYAIRYLNGTLDVYFDASIAAIQAGTATSLLTRTTAPRPGYGVGTLVFGDATNDPNFNSSYVVDSVDFQDLAAVGPATVPEPATFSIVALALAAGGAVGGRRREAHASAAFRVVPARPGPTPRPA